MNIDRPQTAEEWEIPSFNLDDIKLRVPRELRRGRLRADEEKSIRSGFVVLELMKSVAPLEGLKILDFGCGVKIAQVLLQSGSPHAKYVGLDLFRDMIDYLKENVSDPRYTFETVNFHNKMYNYNGERMTPASRLPIEDDTFDLITLFSVITHQTPDDAHSILAIMRSYAHPKTKMIFSTFVSDDQKIDWVDKRKDKPLLRCFFRQAFLEEIVAQAGWDIESSNPGIKGALQHYYICTPKVKQ